MSPTRKALELLPQQNSSWLNWYLEMVDRTIRQNAPALVIRNLEMQRQQQWVKVA